MIMTLVLAPVRVCFFVCFGTYSSTISPSLVDLLQEPPLECLGYLSQHGSLWSQAILLRYRERGSSKILEQDSNSPAMASTRFHDVIITRRFLEDILSRL